MKKAKKQNWLEADQICLAQGDAVALNLMFETKKDHQRFLRMWNRYLGEMAEVINYYLSPTGWTILFRTRKSIEIFHAYKKQRKKSKKAMAQCELQCSSKILSEHFRIFLSQYVRSTNAANNRKGTLVMERFQKYVLKNGVDYEKFFALITHKQRHETQRLDKYRADESKYNEDGKLEVDCIWQIGQRRKGCISLDILGLNVLSYTGARNHILRNFQLPLKIQYKIQKSP